MTDKPLPKKYTKIDKRYLTKKEAYMYFVKLPLSLIAMAFFVYGMIALMHFEPEREKECGLPKYCNDGTGWAKSMDNCKCQIANREIVILFMFLWGLICSLGTLVSFLFAFSYALEGEKP